MFPILHHPPWWRWLHPLRAHSPGEAAAISRWEADPSQDIYPRIWGQNTPSAHPVPRPAPLAAQVCPRSHLSSIWSSPWQRPHHCQTDPLQRQEGSMGLSDIPVPAHTSSDTLAPTQPVPRWCQYRGHRKIPLRNCSPSPGQCSASAILTGSVETHPLPPAEGSALTAPCRETPAPAPQLPPGPGPRDPREIWGYPCITQSPSFRDL